MVLFKASFHQVGMLFIKCWAVLRHNTLFQMIQERKANLFHQNALLTHWTLKGFMFAKLETTSNYQNKRDDHDYFFLFLHDCAHPPVMNEIQQSLCTAKRLKEMSQKQMNHWPRGLFDAEQKTEKSDTRS